MNPTLIIYNSSQFLAHTDNRNNAVILLICFIYLGSKRPVCLVGNKVDLVPLDGKGSLDRMKTALIESATVAGLNKVNLKHVALISSKTGFGIEELITKLWNSWKNKG